MRPNACPPGMTESLGSLSDDQGDLHPAALWPGKKQPSAHSTGSSSGIWVGSWPQRPLHRSACAAGRASRPNWSRARRPPCLLSRMSGLNSGICRGGQQPGRTVAAEVFHALADKHQVRIVPQLLDKALACSDSDAYDLSELCCDVGELARALEIAPPSALLLPQGASKYGADRSAAPRAPHLLRRQRGTACSGDRLRPAGKKPCPSPGDRADCSELG